MDTAHPDPDKDADGVRLRHSLVESPTRGDNLYRFRVTVAEGEVGKQVAHDLPDYFRWLNEDAQCWVSPVRHFGRAWAEARKNGQSYVLCADTAGEYNVLIIATRKDATAVRGWDETGGLEPLANDADRARQHQWRDEAGKRQPPRPPREAETKAARRDPVPVWAGDAPTSDDLAAAMDAARRAR